MTRAWRGWALIGLAVVGLALAQPALAASGDGWTMERPAARRAATLDAALPPVAASGTVDGESDAAPAGSPALLQAAPGVTALAGRVLQVDGTPLVGVELRLGTRRVRTGPDGLYLIEDAPAGYNVLTIDGRLARTSGGGEPVDHGLYEARVKVEPGRTTQLPWVSWLAVIDHAHDVAIPEVLDKEITVANPDVPGVELKLPAGATLTGIDGERVKAISVTKLSDKRGPFPMVRHRHAPIYATFQPGGARIASTNGDWLGAQIVYANVLKLPAGARTSLLAYDPDHTGWQSYGHGRVSDDGLRIEGEVDARLYALSNFLVPINPNDAPDGGPPPSCGSSPDSPPSSPPGTPPCTPRDGAVADPVDLATGLFIMDRADLVVDDVMPISVRRVYKPDHNGRAFGTGMALSYDIFFVAVDTADPGILYLADGSAVPFVPSMPQVDAIGYASGWITTTPGPFYNSTIIQDPVSGMWVLTRADNYKFYFGGFDDGMLHWIVDPHGNRISIERDGNLRTRTIISPNGRHINFTYNNNSQIATASDDLGRTITYNYEGGPNLLSVVDADGKTTSYGWDSSNRLTSVTYPNGGVLTNVYNAANRITGQTQPDGKTWGFGYTLDNNGNVTATSVTDPRGSVENYAFNASMRITGDVKAVGTPLQSTYSFTLDPYSQLPLAVVDPLGRTTAYTRDSAGRPLTVTQLSGTANAVKTAYTYAWPSMAVATVTDPLGHKWTYGRNAAGDLTSVTDPLGLVTTYSYDVQGHRLTATDPLTNKTTYAYTNGDLASVTDPLSRKSKFFEDALGRLILSQSPGGGVATLAYDPQYGPTQTVDANGFSTTSAYSVTGQLASVTDARGGKIAYGYDLFDRLLTYTDALLKVATINSRDGLGNILTATDRKGQVATFTYDALNRPATATYADGSTVSYTFDLGGRLTQVQDSAGGTVTRAYDGLDRMTSETTAQGTVSYTYDAANRLTGLQAPGQALVVYGYDNSNRLTSITQGTTSVAFGYDNAGRRTSATLPNGIAATYTYDAASELTGISYATSGGTSLGTLTYTYGPDGQVTLRSGTLFTSVLPGAVTSSVYDAGNRVTSRVTSTGTQTPSWDANGSLASDGLNAYTWDARNRMKTIGSLANFVYDAFGRRVSLTKSGTTTSFLYAGDDIVQAQVGGAATANLLLGLGTDERLSYNGSTYLTDLLGSTIGLSTGSAVQTSYGYDPYGTATSAGAATINTFQFTGRESDGTAAGLLFYRARYYNPAWGRFVSEDPIGVAGGVNLYAYVGQNPVRWRDPSGHARDGTPGNNQRQNKQFADACKKLGIDPNSDAGRRFHEDISGRNLGWKELLEEGEAFKPAPEPIPPAEPLPFEGGTGGGGGGGGGSMPGFGGDPLHPFGEEKPLED